MHQHAGIHLPREANNPNPSELTGTYERGMDSVSACVARFVKRGFSTMSAVAGRRGFEDGVTERLTSPGFGASHGRPTPPRRRCPALVIVCVGCLRRPADAPEFCSALEQEVAPPSFSARSGYMSIARAPMLAQE